MIAQADLPYNGSLGLLLRWDLLDTRILGRKLVAFLIRRYGIRGLGRTVFLSFKRTQTVCAGYERYRLVAGKRRIEQFRKHQLRF